MVAIGDLMKLTRDDILDFPGETVDLIMDLQKDGWRAQRGKRGHVMLLAPDGVSKYSASRNANSAKYLREDIARYKKGEAMLGEPQEEESEMNVKVEVGAVPKFPCPHKDCNKTFMSQDFLNVHIGVDHEGLLACPEKDCFELFSKPQALGRHRQAKHGYVSPNKPKRKAQESRRAEKESKGTDIKVDMVVKSDGSVEETDGIPIKEIVGSVTVFDPPLEFQPSDEIILAPSDQAKIKDYKHTTEIKAAATGPVSEPTILVQHNHVAESLSASEVYRHTQNQLRVAKSEEVVRTENDIEFLDTRDSWVVDDPELMTSSVNSIKKILNAVGLEMEIRVWRKK